MEKRFITLRDGKKIYVEIFNNGHKNNLLMLHGGPGEGCFGFQYQAIKLSEYFNVFTFDQRGVLRSDKINDDEDFGLEQLVDDCEDLKNVLGINNWSVLGHSFGGEIALLYEIKYPLSVDKVIFECPTFYYPMSIRSIYAKCIEIAEKGGMIDYAKEIKTFIDSNNDIKLIANNIRKVQIAINKVAPKIVVSEEIESINEPKDITDEQWENGKIHFERLQKEGKINKNMIHLISNMKCPSLLILGKTDPVCFKEQQEYYSNSLINGSTIIFEKSDHRPHDEEPDKFTKTIRDFLSN